MQDLIEQPGRYLATLERMLIAGRMTQAADVVRAVTPRIERTGYDNRNGGTEQWAVFLSIDPSEHTQMDVRSTPIPHECYIAHLRHTADSGAERRYTTWDVR